MYTCPHCGKAGISLYKKLTAGTAIPAICTNCKETSCLSWSVSLATTLLCQLAVIAGIILALMFSNLWLFLLTIIALLISEVVIIHFGSLTPLSDEKVKRAKIISLIFFSVLILLILLCGFY